MKVTLLACQLLTVIILASTFGLTLLAIVKCLLMEATALVPLHQEGILHHTLVTVTTVRHPLRAVLLIQHNTLTTHCGTELVVQEALVATTLLSLGSIVN